MNIGIIYASKTGNTAHLAKIAFDTFEKHAHTVTLVPIENFNFVKENQFDLIVVGSYCDSNSFPKSIKKLFESLKHNKRTACFVTHATEESGEYYNKWAAGCNIYYNDFCTSNKIESAGYFHCRSKPSKVISMFIKVVVFKGNKKAWSEYNSDMNTYPSEIEISRFRDYINDIATS